MEIRQSIQPYPTYGSSIGNEEITDDQDETRGHPDREVVMSRETQWCIPQAFF